MEVNEKPSKQKSILLEMMRPILEELWNKMEFSHAYLYSKDVSQNKGMLHVHIVYNALYVDGELSSISAGYFGVEVDNLTNFTGWIQNTIHYEVAGKYLHDTWLCEAPLYSRASIHFLEVAMQK